MKDLKNFIIEGFIEVITVIVAAVIALWIITSLLGMLGCGASCQEQRAVVDAMKIGIDSADNVVGQRGGESYERASMIAHGAQSIGEAAMDRCGMERDGAGWSVWVAFAAEALGWIVSLIEGAGPDDIDARSPIELLRALAMLEYEATR